MGNFLIERYLDDAPKQVALMIELCRLTDLCDGEAKGFCVEGETIAQRLIIIRIGSNVRAYINLCPHIGSRLDGEVGQFIQKDKPELLFCNSHAAYFRIEDGLCIDGPCEGQKLYPAAVILDGDKIVYTRSGVKVVEEISKIVSTID